METRHLDGNKTNNKLENLAWGTKEENENDKFAHGTHHIDAKLTAEQVKNIRLYDLLKLFSVSDMARIYHVSTATIKSVITHRTYKWSRDYVNRFWDM